MSALKTIGLVAIAALASMAFVGASTASAETLCLENVGHANECPENKRWAGKEKDVVGLSEAAVLLSSLGNLTCKSEVLGEWKENEGAHTGVKYLLHELTFSNCEGPCKTAKAHSIPLWLLAVALKKEEVGLHALVWGDEPESLLPGALLEGCTIFNVNCLYETEAHKALLDIADDRLIANEVPLVRSIGHSGLCPATGTWDAEYLIVEDIQPAGEHGEPLYLAALP